MVNVFNFINLPCIINYMKYIILITTLLFSLNLSADDSAHKKPQHKDSKEISSHENHRRDHRKNHPNKKRKNQHPPKKDVGPRN